MNTERKSSLVVPAIFSFVAFAGLLALAGWQFSRHLEKTSFIAAYQQNLDKPATPLITLVPELIAELDRLEQSQNQAIDTAASTEDNLLGVAQRSAIEFRNVSVTGQLLFDREAYVVGYSVAGSPGFKVMNPMILDEGAIIMVERGWVSADAFAQSNRPEQWPTSQRVTLNGLVRYPSQAGTFTPDNEPHNNLWFSVDLQQMLETIKRTQPEPSLDERVLLPFYLLADRNPYGAYPQGRQWRLNIQNPHRGYAVTWLALAVAVAVMFAVVVRQKRKT